MNSVHQNELHVFIRLSQVKYLILILMFMCVLAIPLIIAIEGISFLPKIISILLNLSLLNLSFSNLPITSVILVGSLIVCRWFVLLWVFVRLFLHTLFYAQGQRSLYSLSDHSLNTIAAFQSPMNSSPHLDKIPIRGGISTMHAYLGDAYITADQFVRYQPHVSVGLLKALGLQAKSVALPTEDPVTYAMNAAKGLIEQLDRTEDIEYIEVATESPRDGSLPMSQHIIQLLDHHDILSMESKHACIAGVNAIYRNCIDRGLIITTDIAEYANDDNTAASAEFTGGAGAIAIKTSEAAELLEILSVRGSSADLTYDFYKPYHQQGDELIGKTYPIVFGKFSNLANIKRVLLAYENLKQKIPELSLTDFSGIVLHCPYPGITKYNIAALVLSDVQNQNDNTEMDFSYLVTLLDAAHHTFDQSIDDLYFDTIANLERDVKLLLKEYMKTEEFITAMEKLEPSLDFIQYTSNLYTGSSPLCMMSLLENTSFGQGEYILWGGYGSGNQAMFMIARTTESTQKIATTWKTKQHRLDGRVGLSGFDYKRLKTYPSAPYSLYETEIQYGITFKNEVVPSIGLYFVKNVNQYQMKKYELSGYEDLLSRTQNVEIDKSASVG